VCQKTGSNLCEVNNNKKLKVDPFRACLDSGAKSTTLNDIEPLISQIPLTHLTRDSLTQYTASGEAVAVQAIGAVSDMLPTVRVCEDLDQSLLAVLDLTEINNWVLFIPKMLGGGAMVCDLDRTVLGITDKDYDIDLRELGKVVGKIEPPKLNLKQISLPVTSLNKIYGKCNTLNNLTNGIPTKCSPSDSIMAWHAILGHPTKEKMKSIARNGLVDGITFNAEQVEQWFVECPLCIKGKMRRNSLPMSDTDYHTSCVGAVVEMDIYGAISPPTIGGCSYVMTCYDRHSGYTIAKIVKSKDEEAVIIFMREICQAFRRAHHPIDVWRTDHEAVLKAPEVQKVAAEEHIIPQKSAPYTHGQVGGIERRHGTLGNDVAIMFAEAPWMPKGCWGYAVQLAILMKNMLPCRASGSEQSPWTLFHGTPYSLKHRPVLPFGTSVLVLQSKEERDWKFGARAVDAWYLGPDMQVKDAIVVYVIETSHITRRHDFRVIARAPLPTDLHHHCKTDIFYDLDVPALEGLPRWETSDNLQVLPQVVSSRVTRASQRRAEQINQGFIETESMKQSGGRPRLRLMERSSLAVERERAEREKALHLLSGLYTGTLNRANCRRLVLTMRKLRKKAGMKDDSPTLSQALKSPNAADWVKAIDEELTMLENMGCWEVVVNIPRGARILPCHIVLKAKRKADGEFDKYKARLVAGGNLQDPADTANTASPTARQLSINILLSITCSNHLFLKSFDIKGAFLHSYLPDSDPSIYVRFPDDTRLAGTYGRLIKSLYGLRQAPTLWNTNLDECLRNFGLVPTSDPCLYHLESDKGDYMIVAVHVDDLLVASTDEGTLEGLRGHLEQKYGKGTVTDSDASSHLGLSIRRDIVSGSIRLTQPALIDKIALILQIDPETVVDTPYLSNNVSAADDTLSVKSDDMRVVVGMLNYMCMSRPDLRYAVSFLATRCVSPSSQDWKRAQRVAQYLCSTRHLGLTFQCDKDIQLMAYMDASYAGHEDAKSHSGMVLTLGPSSGPIYSKSTKQTITALSSTEAEMDAVCAGCTTVVAARRLLGELGFTQKDATPVYEDNMSTIALTRGTGNWGRTKHFSVRYNFVRQLVEENAICMKYIASEEQVADLLTKELPARIFIPLRNRLLGLI
jgi:hypothetical protein